VVTPFKSNFEIDYPALDKVLDSLINNNVEYIVTLGTTGETPVLDKQEKIDIVNHTFDKVAGRVPIVVGIGGNNTHELIKDLHQIPLDKAVAVLSASPYYNKPSQEGIYFHYKAIAEASPKPIILYNVPGRTGKNMTADTTLRLANDIPNIVGIKEASGDMAQCMVLLRDRPSDFLIVSGDDALALPQLACGMDGVISVAANAFPKEFSEMVRYCLNGDFASAKQINDTLIKAYELMFAENNPAGVKAFMTEMGLLENFLRLPGVPLSKGIHHSVKMFLEN
jgi:4-hydroxy-tetrahydrodipicolinate synthase